MIVIRLWVFRGYSDIQSGQIHACQNLSAGKERDVKRQRSKRSQIQIFTEFQIFVFHAELQRSNHTQLIIFAKQEYDELLFLRSSLRKWSRIKLTKHG